MSRIGSALLFSLILLIAVSTVNASIVGHICTDDGDGAIVMGPATLIDNGNHDYDLTMSGAQYWGPAHLCGSFTTDTELDPTVRIIEDVSNDTTFAWTDYHITIGMSQIFSFVNSGLLAPAGWNATIVAVAPGMMPNGGGPGYVGTINYVMGSGGSPIVIGDDGTFGFKVSFLGSTVFSTAQVPTPEPATIALLGLGAISMIRRRRV